MTEASVKNLEISVEIHGRVLKMFCSRASHPQIKKKFLFQVSKKTKYLKGGKLLKARLSVCINQFMITKYTRKISFNFADFQDYIEWCFFHFDWSSSYEWSSDIVVIKETTIDRKWTGRNSNFINNVQNVFLSASYYEIVDEWQPKHNILRSNNREGNIFLEEIFSSKLYIEKSQFRTVALILGCISHQEHQL